MSRINLILIAALALGGCFKLNFPDGRLLCSTSGSCPGGYRCVAGACYLDGDNPDLAGGVGMVGDSDLSVGPTGGDGATGGGPGASCRADSDCMSGHCADSVCCESACNGSCNACNLPGNAGKCLNMPPGAKPSQGHSACAMDAANSCGHNGTCDGAGNCAYYSGNVCKPGSCDSASNKYTGDSKCDGKGTCAAPMSIACDPFKCKPDHSACATTCGSPTDCTMGQPCVGTSCGPQGQGTQCMHDGDCKSGHCVDGVCCESACSGSCVSCNAPGGTPGKCTPTPLNTPDPRGGCAADTTNCVAGGCDGKGACAVTGAGVTCKTSCAQGGAPVGQGQRDLPSFTRYVCNGTSSGCSMVDTSVTSCNGNLCADGTNCKASCAFDAECAVGYYCAGSTCHAKKANGAGCAQQNECASFHCAANVCVQCVSNMNCPSNQANTCIGGNCVACTVSGTGNSCGYTQGATHPQWGAFCNLPGLPGCSCKISDNGGIPLQSNVDCTNGRAPFCGGDPGYCTCTTNGAACPDTKVCTPSRSCLVESNYPCVQNADCATGSCVNGLCAIIPWPTNTFCNADTDCQSDPAGNYTYCARVCQSYSGG